jgi:hypothetical protein
MEAVLSRGRKKPSLRDLSNVLILDDHIQDIIHELDNQSDRGVALIAAALVDVSLIRLMRCRMVGFKDFEQILFEREGAPLSTFSARIKVARGFGVLGPLAEAHMDAMRRVRNQFAHSPLKIDFTHELIAKEIDKLLPDDNPAWKPEFSTERRRYVGTAILLVQGLEQKLNEHLPETVTVWTN